MGNEFGSFKMYLFGPPRVERDGEPLDLRRRKSLALLAYLAVTDQPHSRDSLAALFWPEHDQSSARSNLRRELYRLKNALGERALQIEREQIEFIAGDEMWLDVLKFQKRIEFAQQHDHISGQYCKDCLTALSRAAELYTDDFMSGFSLPDSIVFDEWQFFQNENLRQSLARALQQLIDWHSKPGEYEEAIVYARRWLALDSLHEPAHRRLMLLYAWSGQQSAALRQYQECARLLREELNIDPEEETTALYESIRTKKIGTKDTELQADIESKASIKPDPLPQGIATLLVTGIEGSTTLWERDPEGMAVSLEHYRSILREAVQSQGGHVGKLIGDEFQAIFDKPDKALNAAVIAQQKLDSQNWESEPIQVRMAVHTGPVKVREGDYISGHTFNRAARILSAGHGGQILLSRAATELVSKQLPENVRLKDLGRHNLKGLNEPEQIFQVLATELPTSFPPLISRSIQVHNLPSETGPFIGREEELTQLQAILSRPDARLVSIIALGGTGKTQLAAKFARQLVQKHPELFADGIFFVPLAGVDSVEALPVAVAKALHISLAGQVDPIVEVSNYLRDREVLLILDNFEQLIEGTRMINRLLADNPGIKFLVTSREPLRLATEWRFDLEGLPYPKSGQQVSSYERSPDSIVEYACVDLFLQTARQIGVDFELNSESAPHVIRLCELVGGLPLAIKLAANWLRVMPCEQIVEEVSRSMEILTTQMRDIPARQRSMRAVFEYTWELLLEEEQIAFQALSIFRGGFDEQAAREVTGVSPFLLAGLIDRGLLQRVGEDRYEVHELTRQFAASKLKSTDIASKIANQHSTYYLNFARQQAAPLYGEHPTTAISALKGEIDNIRKAWEWACENTRIDLIKLAIDGLASFYEFAGLISEGTRIFKSAAQRIQRESSGPEAAEIVCGLLIKHLFLSLIRGKGENIEEEIEKVQQMAIEQDNQSQLADIALIRGFWHEFKGEYETAIANYTQAKTHYEDLEQKRESGTALNQIGETLVFMSQPSKSQVYHLQALRLGFSLKDMRLRALSLSYLGVASYYLDDYPQAVDYWEQAIALFEQLEDSRGLGRTMNNIAHVHNLLGNHLSALEYITPALKLLQQIDDYLSQSAAYDTKGNALFALGHYDEARACYTQAIHNAQETGLMRQLEAGFLTSLGVLETAEGNYAQAEQNLQNALDIVWDLAPPKEIAHTLCSLGDLYTQTGRTQKALEHYDRALDILKQVGEKSETGLILVQKAAALHQHGDHERSLTLLQEGLAIVEPSRRKPAIFRALLLKAELAHAMNKQADALEQLQALLEQFHAPTEQAAIYFLLWQIRKDRSHGGKALQIYQEMASETPNVLYHQRLQELRTQFED
jgi:DNA-binding SARP family transcriptional activator/predicted ATPase